MGIRDESDQNITSMVVALGEIEVFLEGKCDSWVPDKLNLVQVCLFVSFLDSDE